MLTWFMGIFLFGTISFWIFFIGFLILLTWLVEFEEGPWALGSLILFLVLMWVGNSEQLSLILSNTKLIVVSIIIYIILGVLWGICKYALRGMDVRAKVAALKKSDDFNYNENSKLSKEFQWDAHIKGLLSYKDYQFLSGPTDRGAIVMWMAYWPVSAFWTILNDPIKKFFNWLYDHVLIGVFANIHKRILGDSLNPD